MERTKGEKVEVLVGVILHGEFHGKRLRFTGREVDRYDTSESRHVLYECGPDRYRILVSRFDDGCEIHPEPQTWPTRRLTSPTGFSPLHRRPRGGHIRSISPTLSPWKT
jgi:hypothetical protein